MASIKYIVTVISNAAKVFNDAATSGAKLDLTFQALDKTAKDLNDTLALQEKASSTAADGLNKVWSASMRTVAAQNAANRALKDTVGSLNDLRTAALAAAAAQTANAAAAANSGIRARGAYGGWFLLLGGFQKLWSSLTQGTGKISLFGGYLDKLLPKWLVLVGGVHLLADVLLEFLAVLVPVSVALGAFGIGAGPVISDIAKHMQNVSTVTKATGGQIGIMNGAVRGAVGPLQRMENAVQPQVYQLFGDAIDIINKRGGILQGVASQTGRVLDVLGARFVVATSDTRVFNKAVAEGPAMLARIGDIIANFGAVLGQVILAVPGYANILLSLFDSFSKAAAFIAQLAEPLMRVGLQFHGFILWVGLAVTAVLLLGGPLGRAAIAIKLFGLQILTLGAEMLTTAAAGDIFAAAMLLVDATGGPVVWITAAVVALGFLIAMWVRSKDAVQQFTQAQQQMIMNAPIQSALTMIIADQGQAASDLNRATVKLTHTQKDMTAENFHSVGSFKMLTPAYRDQQAQVGHLGDRYKLLTDESDLFGQRLGILAKKYSGVTAATGLLVAAGITTQQMLNKSKEAWAIVLAQVEATTVAYAQMGQTGGVLGADMNAMTIAASEQVSAMQKLNSAWDTTMSIVSGGQNAFITFQQDIISVNMAFAGTGGTARNVTLTFAQAAAAARQAGASMNGTNAASLQLRQTWQSAFGGATTLMDALRMMQAASPGGFPSVTKVAKDTVQQLAQFGGQSAATRAELVALVQQFDPAITNWSELVKWMGKTKDPAKQANDLIARMGINLQDLAKDAAATSTNMQAQLIATFNAAKLAASGTDKAISDLGAAMGATHPNAVKIQQDAQILYDKLVTVDHMGKTAATDFVTSLDPAFKNTGDQAHTAAGKTGELISQLLGVPKNVSTKISVGGGGTLNVSGALTVTEAAKYLAIGFHMSGGQHATGGMITGGVAGKDSVVGLLTPGEVVVPQPMVAAGAVDHLRGRLPGFASGGKVGSKPMIRRGFTLQQEQKAYELGRAVRELGELDIGGHWVHVPPPFPLSRAWRAYGNRRRKSEEGKLLWHGRWYQVPRAMADASKDKLPVGQGGDAAGAGSGSAPGPAIPPMTINPGTVPPAPMIRAGVAVDPAGDQRPVARFAKGGVVTSFSGDVAGIGPWYQGGLRASQDMALANSAAAETKMVNDGLDGAINQALKEYQAFLAGLGGSGNAIVAYAKSFLGKIPYVWGGTTLGAAGADCSGFTGSVYRHFGYNPPRTSEAQFGWVRRTPPTAGGLAFYDSPAGGPPPGHVAIVQDGSWVVSQGGGMGPQMMPLHGLPLMGTGIPPSGFGAGPGSGGQVGPNSVRGWLLTAMNDTGAPMSWLSPLMEIQQKETDNLANMTTVVNPNGGATGLMQVKPGTFAQFATVPGGIDNPVANSVAAIRHIMSAWGSPFNIPGIGAPGAYQGYRLGGLVETFDQGGWLRPGLNLAMNNTGAYERVSPPGSEHGDVVDTSRLEEIAEAHLEMLQVLSAQLSNLGSNTSPGANARALAAAVIGRSGTANAGMTSTRAVPSW